MALINTSLDDESRLKREMLHQNLQIGFLTVSTIVAALSMVISYHTVIKLKKGK